MAIPDLLPLFRQLNDLKRLRAAGRDGSIAERLFRRSWSRLVAGESLETVALNETAGAVIAAKLAGIDAEVLADGGLDAAQSAQILQRAFDASADVLPAVFAERLRAHIAPASAVSGAIHLQTGADSDETSAHPATVGAHSSEAIANVETDNDTAANRDTSSTQTAFVPEFVELLTRQPRAGATRPGYARVVLEPTENHAEHCAIVAVNCVLAASLYDADVGAAFLTGLSHHFHNAYLPDAGDAGDALLGEHHARLMETFRARAISQLPPALGERARASLDSVYRSDTPESKAFQVADSLDRVLEMEWHARSAEFTLDVALDEMDIIHPGPVQAFQLEVMRAVGFR